MPVGIYHHIQGAAAQRASGVWMVVASAPIAAALSTAVSAIVWILVERLADMTKGTVGNKLDRLVAPSCFLKTVGYFHPGPPAAAQPPKQRLLVLVPRPAAHSSRWPRHRSTPRTCRRSSGRRCSNSTSCATYVAQSNVANWWPTRNAAYRFAALSNARAVFSLQQSQQVDAKISEIEAEMQEHYLVTKQLEKVEGGRTCTSRFCRTLFQLERSTFHSYGAHGCSFLQSVLCAALTGCDRRSLDSCAGGAGRVPISDVVILVLIDGVIEH